MAREEGSPDHPKEGTTVSTRFSPHGDLLPHQGDLFSQKILSTTWCTTAEPHHGRPLPARHTRKTAPETQVGASRHTRTTRTTRTPARTAAAATHPHDFPGDALGLDEHRVLHLRAVGLEVRVVAGPSLGSLGKPPDHHLLRLCSKQELDMSEHTSNKVTTRRWGFRVGNHGGDDGWRGGGGTKPRVEKRISYRSTSGTSGT